MQSQDRKRFGLCLVAMAEVYGKTPSDAVIALWWHALHRFDVEAVASAFERHVTNPDVGQWMPKPADVIRMLEGTSIDVAMVAWAKVDKAVRSVGGYASVAFDDALVHRVVHDMGGWIGLNGKTLDEWPFVGNEFRTRYTAFRSRQETPEYPTRLIGISEANNTARGLMYAVGEVVLIGDPDQARRVLAGGTDKPTIGFTRAKAPDNVRPLRALPQVLEVVGEAK